MRKDEAKAIRGVWEREPGSNVWWIRYRDASGKLRREKVGRKGDAIDLLNKRRNDRRVGVKMPDNLRNAGIRFGMLADDIETYSKAHHRDQKHIVSRLKRIRPDFGERVADSITPQEIDAWLTNNTKKPATSNRYRALFSLVFREALRNGKVKSNPARLVQMRTENNARLRFLSRNEYKKLLDIIKRDNAEQVPAFIVSVYTGMRWGEQYSLTWEQVDLKRKVIRLTKTKNGSARNVPLNSVALEALKEQQASVAHQRGDDVFPRPGPSSDCRWWFAPALTEAEITDYTWHNNRHTFCSWLAMAGVSTKEIQVLAGHKTIAMAARYAHLSPEATASASERLVTGP
jgi:integrase